MTSASPQPNVVAAKGWGGFAPGFWLALVVTGVTTGLAAGLLMKLLRLLQHVAWSYRDGPFLDAVEHASTLVRILVPVSAGVLVAIVLPLLAKFLSKGPSDLEATIWFRDGRLPPLVTSAKAVLSIVIVALGASLGREAAPKQAGALLGGLLADWRGLATTKRRLLAACGAGAGIAAVYNVPFGGALFALEVLLGSLSLSLVAPAFLVSLLATVTAWLFLPDVPSYEVPSLPLSPGLLVWSILFAPVAGVASALFVKGTAGVAALKPMGRAIAPAAIGVFFALGCLAVPYPQLLGNGKDVVELAALDRIALPTLAALVVLKPLVTLACLGTGAPGGLFTPTMTFGALLGGVCGHLWLLAWPGAPAGAFALVGAATVLAATTKGPVSALVLATELSRHIDGLMVPMLIAISIAVGVAHWLDARSTYTCRLGPVSSLRFPDDAPTVSVATSYVEVMHKLLRLGGPLRVLDADSKVVGELSRGDLETASHRLRPLEIATAIDVLETKA